MAERKNLFRTADNRLILWKLIAAGAILGIAVVLAYFGLTYLSQSQKVKPVFHSTTTLDSPPRGGEIFSGIVVVPSFDCGSKICIGIVDDATDEQLIGVYPLGQGYFDIGQQVILYAKKESTYKLDILRISPLVVGSETDLHT